MFEADCGASGTACVSARGAPSPWPATRVGRVAGVSHPHACATPRHHAPAVYERDGEPRVARNDPIALPSLRSRARGALYSIRYAYFGWRVSSRTLMINARRNGPGDGPARSRFDSVSRRRVRASRRRQAPGVATPARGPSARLRVRSGEPDPIPFILHSLPRAAPAA